MAEYVPESPTSVASSWFSDIPFEEEEDVIVPIWDILHDDLFRQEGEVREVWSLCEQRLRDFLYDQYLTQRD